MPDDDSKSKGPRVSRREKLEGFKYPYDEPPEPDSHEYLVAWWLKSGMVTNNGMGLSGLSNQELLAFNERSGYQMTAWELDQIFNMSRVYAAGISGKYKDKTCKAPYKSAETRQAEQERQEAYLAHKKRREERKKQRQKG